MPSSPVRRGFPKQFRNGRRRLAVVMELLLAAPVAEGAIRLWYRTYSVIPSSRKGLRSTAEAGVHASMAACQS